MRAVVVRRWSARLGAIGLALVAVAVPSGPAQAATGCEVAYTASSWGTGFVGNAQIKNLGDTWASHTIQFTLAGAQTAVSAGGYPITQSGPEVTAQSPPWAPPVPTGRTLSFGFTGRYTGASPAPTNWRVNGAWCVSAGQPPTVIAEPTSATVSEGGGASFTVRLSHPPSGTVYLSIRIQGTGAWASPPINLIFNPTNWSTPQSYSVYSVPDPDTVDDVAVFTLSVPGYVSDTVTFTQIDDD